MLRSTSNKLFAAGLLIILLSALSMALPLCQEETDIDDIPCLGLTAVLSCSANVTVTNLNSSQTFNLTTTVQGDSTYNFTFSFNQSSYSIKACNNSTATIVVGDFEGDRLWKVAIILGFVGIALIYGCFGRFIFDTQSWIMKSGFYLASVLAIVLAVQAGLLMSPVANIGKLMTVSLTASTAAVGVLFLYLFVFSTVNTVRALRGQKEERDTEP